MLLELIPPPCPTFPHLSKGNSTPNSLLTTFFIASPATFPISGSLIYSLTSRNSLHTQTYVPCCMKESHPLNILLPAANHIAAIIGTRFAKTTPKTRANVKWSKILINGVPTGKSQSREPYNPDECHQALLENNPAYVSLTIMQKPSWVK